MRNIQIILMTNGHAFTAHHRLPLVNYIESLGYKVSICVPTGSDALQVFLDNKFKCYDFRLSSNWGNPLSELLSLIDIYKIYKQIKPDLIIHSTIKPVIYGTAISLFLRIPSVINIMTGLGHVFTDKKVIVSLIRQLILKIYSILFYLKKPIVVFQNEDDRKYFIKNTLLKINRTKLVKGSGVDELKFQLSPINPTTKNIILVGRMLWDKGIQCFYNAAKIVKRKFPDAKFILIGPLDKGNPSSIPLELLENWNKDGIVEWHGEISNIINIYQEANIVVLPSHREGMPKTLLEAASCGRPIIATDVPGCREIVINKKNGYLVPKDDFQLLSNKIIYLIQNPRVQSQMGNEGRIYIENNYTTRIIMKKMRHIIESELQIGDVL